MYVVKIVCHSSLSVFVLNLTESGNLLFSSVPNGDCLFSSASLSLIGDKTLVHERRVMTAEELHVNATYYTPDILH